MGDLKKKKDIVLRPTGTCFDDMSALFGKLIADGEKNLFLCHGIMTLDNGDLFSHAWLEQGESKVIFTALYNGETVMVDANKKEYLQKSGLVKKTRYSLEKAAIASRLTGGLSGPWRPEYQALCIENL